MAAIEKHRAGDYAGAERVLAPLIAAVLHSDTDDRLSARMLAEYASIQQDMGQPRRAETFYRRSLFVSARLNPADPQRVETLHCLATLYVDTGQYAKAGQLVKELQNVQSAAPPVLRGRMLVTLGSLARSQHDFKEAESFYLRSIALLGNAATNPTPELASALSALGALHLQTGRLEDAAQDLYQALSAFEGVFGATHPALIAPFINLALIERCRGDSGSGRTFRAPRS